ncbi:transposase [Sphingomonas lacusdianchii]|uniref:transposase n=1 Tax=Sphingomonas lacusdianchii TaxID=2917992 RepID=UPI003D67CA15
MVSTTKRRFTDDFKREAVALWETSGRMQTEVAAELGIMPTMLRRWQRKLQESGAPPAIPAAKSPVSRMASLADQASEIARLRRELDRARMEHDISKTYGPPRPQGVCQRRHDGLHQRIRSQG